MKNNIKRWLYLLAGSGLSANEIRDLCSWLATDAADDIVVSVLELRKRKLHATALGEQVSGMPGKGSRRVSKDGSNNDVADEIDLILRKEAKLSVRAAAEYLAHEVEKKLRTSPTTSDVPNIPVYSKESFRAYLSKLLRLTSPRMLLHLAHRVRDRVAPRPEMAWPLHVRDN